MENVCPRGQTQTGLICGVWNSVWQTFLLTIMQFVRVSAGRIRWMVRSTTAIWRATPAMTQPQEKPLNEITGRSRLFTSKSRGNNKECDLRKLTDEEWEKRLTPEQYSVCRLKGTEPPFTGEYYDNKDDGVYKCVCCGINLFSSKAKYDSGSGWPSFYEPLSDNESNDKSMISVIEKSDSSVGMIRTEVLCKKCSGHLGHVFPDGPAPTGRRFCINSVALKFHPKKHD